jgi:quercetin dioxygenase-like cupin family protein
MKITRIYADAEGESHFGELEIALMDRGAIGSLSEEVSVTGVIFRENEPGYDYDWHTAPRRQFIVLLDGEIEIEVSAGDKRRFRGGDVLLVEDTTGKGHRTRHVIPQRRRSLFLPLPDGEPAAPPAL